MIILLIPLLISLLFLGVWVFSIIEKTTTIREMIITFAVLVVLILLAGHWIAGQ